MHQVLGSPVHQIAVEPEDKGFQKEAPVLGGEKNPAPGDEAGGKGNENIGSSPF